MPETHLRIQRTAGYGGLAALLCGLVLIWHDGRQPVAAAADSFHSAAGAISQSPSPVLLAGGALLFFGVVTLCLAAGIFLMRRILAVRPLRVVPWILAALALALFLAGAGLKIWDTLQPVPLDWFAYEPLTHAQLSSLATSPAGVAARRLMGLGLAVFAMANGAWMVQHAARHQR
ncbi:hypothetical protein [Glutamicibacter nicotianae]